MTKRTTHEKLNNSPTVDERRSKSYKAKVFLSKKFVSICDKWNFTENSLYKKSMNVIDRDDTIEIFKLGETIESGPYGSIIKSSYDPEDEEVTLTMEEISILANFIIILSDTIDELIFKKLYDID